MIGTAEDKINELERRLEIVEQQLEMMINKEQPIYRNMKMQKAITGKIKEYSTQNNKNIKEIYKELYDIFEKESNMNLNVAIIKTGLSKIQTIEFNGWINRFRVMVEKYTSDKIGEWTGDGFFPDQL